MNNLTPYENYPLNESTENGPMGFVISFTAGNMDVAMGYTVAGIYDTFYEFARAVNGDLGFSDDDDDEPMEFMDFEDLMTHLFEAMEIRDGDYNFWHGFGIKPGADGYHSESNMNCYRVADMLEKLFVNPRDVMTSKGVMQNSFDLRYISRSIERDPDKLLMYEDDQEMYKKIIRLLNWDKKKLDAILKVNRIKNQF
jgi:hypothetical protein